MITIDTQQGIIIVEEGGQRRQIPFAAPEAFRLVSDLWLRLGWDHKYVYSFTWLGRPIIQLPEDMIRLQELIVRLQPDVIVETGVAHGGSLVFYASLCRLMGRGRIIGVDVEIRPHNRNAIEAHPLADLIHLIEGDSIAPATVARVREQIRPGETTLVLLDSNHTKAHVAGELEAYSPLVTVGSYIIAMDGIMQQVVGAPRTQADWTWNNPTQAALDFVKTHPAFRIEEPPFAFNEGTVDQAVTYWPSGFIKRLT